MKMKSVKSPLAGALDSAGITSTKVRMKTWHACFSVTYATHVTVEAATEEEARAKFKSCDWSDERTDDLVDHDFDERTKIEDVS